MRTGQNDTALCDLTETLEGDSRQNCRDYGGHGTRFCLAGRPPDRLSVRSVFASAPVRTCGAERTCLMSLIQSRHVHCSAETSLISSPYSRITDKKKDIPGPSRVHYFLNCWVCERKKTQILKSGLNVPVGPNVKKSLSGGQNHISRADSSPLHAWL